MSCRSRLWIKIQSSSCRCRDRECIQVALFRIGRQKFVCQEEATSDASSQVEQAIISEITETMRTKYSSPGSMACADADQVIKDNQLICIRYKRQEAAQVFIELCLLLARAAHWWGVDADDGSREIKIPGVESHFTLYHSVPRDSSGRHDVAITLSRQADLVLLVWEPVNDRMVYVRLKDHCRNISIVSVYAPTSTTEQRDEEAFYSQLRALVERLPRRDLLIVAGDWNGRTGPGDPTTSHLLGRFGLGSRCENGERLLNFADRNRLLVTNTCFQNRKNLC
nr:unnamed protein product [Spirometra erinaceieuropaei]